MLHIIVFVLLLLGSVNTVTAEDNDPVVRIGLTAVVVNDNLRLLEQWAAYFSDKLGQQVEFVRRRSYSELMDLLRTGQVDFGWICGLPFINNRDPEYLKLLSVPVYNNKPLYHSYIIVHRDSPYQNLEDLKGKVFAYSDPDSNSGFLYPQYLISNIPDTPDTYFRQTFFTFNHADTVQAVAAHVADGGAVDSYIWDFLVAQKPEIAEQTRVIHSSPAFGFPPLVSRIGVDSTLLKKMKTALFTMNKDTEGAKILDALMLDRFGEYPPDIFDSIRQMANELRKSLPWLKLTEGP